MPMRYRWDVNERPMRDWWDADNDADNDADVVPIQINNDVDCR